MPITFVCNDDNNNEDDHKIRSTENIQGILILSLSRRVFVPYYCVRSGFDNVNSQQKKARHAFENKLLRATQKCVFKTRYNVNIKSITNFQQQNCSYI